MTHSDYGGAGWQLYLDAIETPRHELIDDGTPEHAQRPALKGAVIDRTVLPTFWRRINRRVFDLLIAGVVLVVTAPVLLVIASLIRATSPGPALFRQERIGHLGRAFIVLKFRTMDVDAEARLPELVAENERFRRGLQNDMKPFEDSRVTRLGSVLRRHSLDELPQLLNVVRGEMTIVGPRPFLPIEAGRFGDALPAVLAAKPGLTGLWQVSGRSDLGFEGRISCDLDYIDTNSLLGDIKICLRTIPAVLRGNGAR